MSSNEEKILELTAQLRRAIEQAKIREKAVEKVRAARREAEQTLWIIRRKTLMEIEELGGFAAAGYATFAEFCRQEMQDVSKSIYSEELTYGYIEKVIFEVPICTYNAGFFGDSGFCRRKGAFQIRKSKGAGVWVLDRAECEKAKKAWDLAKEIATEKHPDKPLPDVNDMGFAIAQLTGRKYEPRLTSTQKAAREIERLRQEVEELRALKANNLPMADYLDSLKAVDRLIEMHCQNPAQQSIARKILIQESIEEAKRYVQRLVARRYAREREVA